MKYNTDWLLNEILQGKEFEYVLFWGHTPSKDHKIGASCMSQWFASSFTVENVKYQTAEHWMMAEKARTFKDFEILPEILAAETPETVKKMGRRIKNFDEKIWDNVKYESVKKGNLHKFSQNEKLLNYLLSTGNKILVEASPMDTVWGIGLSNESADAVKPENWNGQNLLGFALMEVRDELAKLA